MVAKTLFFRAKKAKRSGLGIESGMPIHNRRPPGGNRPNVTSPGNTPTGRTGRGGGVAGTNPIPTTPPDPAAVYDGIAPKYTKPSAAMGTSWGGYSWKAEDLDAVMRQFAVGDAKALIRTAMALDAGDRYLSADELKKAARQMTSYITSGVRFSPSVLADVMQQKGIAEESALLRAAKRVDDGDRILERPELEKAADVLNGLLKANDIAEVHRRLDAMDGVSGAQVSKIGEVEGHAIRAVHLPHTGPGPEPRLKVVVTGGVHGNEPCGTGAAMLLLEQLIKDPKLREEVAFTVAPLLNPRGFLEGTRRTPEDEDLNRHAHVHTHDHEVPEEVAALGDLFDHHKADLVLDLHSGYSGRDGFWVYHRNGEDLAKPAMKRFSEEYPARSVGSHSNPMPAPGIVNSDPPSPDGTHKGTVKDYAVDRGARWAYTVEAPGSVSYIDQVMGENDIVHQLVLEARLTLHREEQAAAGHS
jgi:hypothetical protein